MCYYVPFSFSKMRKLNKIKLLMLGAVLCASGLAIFGTHLARSASDSSDLIDAGVAIMASVGLIIYAVSWALTHREAGNGSGEE